MDNMRILEGWTDEERKELKNAKKGIDVNDFLHIITDFISDTTFNLIWEKYNDAEPDEQISIIRDILDFYTGNAKFPEQKYVLETTTLHSSVHTYIKGILGTTYGGIGTADEIKTTSNKEEALVLSKNAIEQKLGGKYMAFAVPVEEDDE